MIFESGIATKERTANRATIEIKEIKWKKFDKERANILVSSKGFENAPNGRAEVVLKNQTLFPIKNIYVTVALNDSFGNTVGVSSTRIDEISAEDSREVFFTWRTPVELASSVDWRILRSGRLLFSTYIAGILILAALLILVNAVRGARAWIQLGLFSIEPAEIMKLVLILVLAKYFSRRHVEIAHIKHIIISGIYAAIPTLLIFLQPDFGSAIIYVSIWFGMIFVSGVSKKHLFLVLALGILTFAVAWLFILVPYQKARVLTFLNPGPD